MKINKYLLLISTILILIFSVSVISASTVDDTNLTIQDDTNSIKSEINIEVNNNELYSSSNIDTQELKSTDSDVKNWIVNQRNYKMYFDNNNVLKKEYGGQTITFDGEFINKGTITIDSPNTKITGRNTLFNNTVFSLKADGIILSNLNLNLNETYPSNEYSGIFIKANNITVKNINMNYNVPQQGTGFGITCNKGYDEISDVKLINNTINYVGNFATKGYNYGIVLVYTNNAEVSGNLINCQLPLRDVDWTGQIFIGSSMDSVASFVADNCPNLVLSKNNIIASVNKRTGGDPTLDCCLIYKCDNAIIEYNNITEEDYISQKGSPNYLYGLDLYLSEDVIVYKNNIRIRTTGGAEAHGTAYPIQVSGTSNVQIAFNNISSYSNGPNLGIYSNNFYGSTRIDIISNFINVTGNANTGNAPTSWALVAGIEVQDSDDKIMNNTIIVNTISEFKDGQNVYGISYSQKTGGTHKYNIQYNNVSTNGRYAVALFGTTSKVSNSIIANNILKTSYAGGNKAALIMSNGRGNIIVNNSDGSSPSKQMSSDEYNNLLKNYFTRSENEGENNGFNGNGNSFFGFGDNKNNIGLVGNNGKNKHNLLGNNPKNIYSQAKNGNLNSTHYTYGSSGVDIASASSSLGSGGSSANENPDSKVYEVTKKIEPTSINYIQSISLIIFSLILLIIGYRKKEELKEEY